MKSIFSIFSIILILLGGCTNNSRDVVLSGQEDISIFISHDAADIIHWASGDFANDLYEILGNKPIVKLTNETNTGKGNTSIFISCISDSLYKNLPFKLDSELRGKWEKFIIRKHKNSLYIIGSDIRGTVYGIFELAERMGISPWKWWADVEPLHQSEISLKLPKDGITSSPSVQYRGIFLNDEDWGLQPWAAKTFEPEIGDIGPKTYEKIFQLLLRLKANTLWPAMHPCTQAFFSIPGNKEMAEKYHIAIGTSHCEPMLCNNVDEWKREENGPYNYFINSSNVLDYWQNRIEETKHGNNIITLGMRGIHDGKMEGGASTGEKISMMEQIFNDQRQVLESALDKNIDAIPQILIPYKEVLDLYNKGLKVPDDVTLMWTDDNYGYIRRLSDSAERQRKGGSGIYYHISYWGRPHDYLWLSTTQPGLIWYEMKRAYENGARKIWIVNVGDIKPAEYNMEFFLDLAWDAKSMSESTIQEHLLNWSKREFGTNAQEIADVMNEFYRLAMLRKPEFMGWSQTEPTTQTNISDFSQSANGNEIQRRIDHYKQLTDAVNSIKNKIQDKRKDSFFQLVEYPVKGAALMNFKFLYAQQAAYALSPIKQSELVRLSDQAFEEIKNLTEQYNHKISQGKWNHMMSMNPRNLPVFDLPDFPKVIENENSDSVINAINNTPIFIQGGDYNSARGKDNFYWKSINGLGYSNSSVTLFPFTNTTFDNLQPCLEYEFEVKHTGEYIIEIRCLPTHANNFNHQLTVQVNNDDPKVSQLNTRGRSDDWKTNVLRNYNAIQVPYNCETTGKQSLKLFVNQTGIVIDQIAIIPEDYPPFYEIIN